MAAINEFISNEFASLRDEKTVANTSIEKGMHAGEEEQLRYLFTAKMAVESVDMLRQRLAGDADLAGTAAQLLAEMIAVVDDIIDTLLQLDISACADFKFRAGEEAGEEEKEKDEGEVQGEEDAVDLK